MAGKIKLHTSYEKRREQHRDISRERGWGKGMTTGIKFSCRLLYPGFWGAWLAIGLLWIIVTLLPGPADPGTALYRKTQSGAGFP